MIGLPNATGNSRKFKFLAICTSCASCVLPNYRPVERKKNRRVSERAILIFVWLSRSHTEKARAGNPDPTLGSLNSAVLHPTLWCSSGSKTLNPLATFFSLSLFPIPELMDRLSFLNILRQFIGVSNLRKKRNRETLCRSHGNDAPWRRTCPHSFNIERKPLSGRSVHAQLEMRTLSKPENDTVPKQWHPFCVVVFS